MRTLEGKSAGRDAVDEGLAVFTRQAIAKHERSWRFTPRRLVVTVWFACEGGKEKAEYTAVPRQALLCSRRTMDRGLVAAEPLVASSWVTNSLRLSTFVSGTPSMAGTARTSTWVRLPLYHLVRANKGVEGRGSTVRTGSRHCTSTPTHRSFRGTALVAGLRERLLQTRAQRPLNSRSLVHRRSPKPRTQASQDRSSRRPRADPGYNCGRTL